MFQHSLEESLINKRSSGVSIAELAIVVVIIALLVSIIAGGLNLRKASELRSFIMDVESFQASIEGFDYKYEELPGDMPNAHDYWDNGSNTVCGTSAQCNGDGDSYIELSSTGSDNESFRAWQHLVLSGFKDSGGFTGVGTGDGDQADIGINVPKSNRDKAGFMIIYDNKGGFYRNEIQLGAFEVSGPARNSILSPKEANIIDKKMDDGVPNDGSVFGYDGQDGTNCLASGGSSYNLTRDEISCRMSFKAN